MHSQVRDGVNQRALNVVSRRSSILAIGGSALAAALAKPASTRAGKSGKNKNAKKRCKRQVQQCRNAYVDICDVNVACTETVATCCAHLATCNAGAAFECLLTQLV
jgi:hypothetical protein